MRTATVDASTERAQFLKRVSLFAGLNDAALAQIARVCQTRSIHKGGILFHQDDQGQSAYVVRSGVIRIVLCTSDGRELVINEMRTGDCFGELALLSDAVRSATAIAGVASEILVIPRQEFLSALSAEPKLMQQLMETLAQRLRSSAERERAFAFLDAPARLARTMLQLDRQASADGYITISQEEISQHIGIARQTTAKILGQWRRKGWIITGRGRILILDRNALRKLSSTI